MVKSCHKSDFHLFNHDEQLTETTNDGTVEIKTRSGDYINPEDKYEFPDISGMNDWESIDIITRRKAALQIPENVLATISTAGLLETCLEYPYNIDIIFYSGFQQGFEALVAQFNGYRELLQRPDLVDALLDKYYYGLTTDVESVRLLEIVEHGRFLHRLFIFEFMLAQDIVLANLSEEQERELFLLSLEHKEIKNGYPDIFTALADLPVCLLYAKQIMNDNAAGNYVNELSEFIKTPRYLNPNTAKYLDDYINTKYK